MTDFCTFSSPDDSSCTTLREYILDILDALEDMPFVKYMTSASSPSGATLSALWHGCVVPLCAIVIVFVTGTSQFEVYSYISSTWRLTGTVEAASPYYTDFSCDNLEDEGWTGGWVTSERGAHAVPVLSEYRYVENRDFEAYWTGAVPPGWTLGDGSVAEENTIVQKGNRSVKLTASTSGATLYFGNIYQLPVTLPGRWFSLSAYLYVPTTTGVIEGSVSASGGWIGVGAYVSVKDEWNEVTVTDLALTSNASFSIGAVTTISGEYIYADNTAFREILSGHMALKDFESATGTFYMDINAAGSTQMGIILNYDDPLNYAVVVISPFYGGTYLPVAHRLHFIEIIDGVATILYTDSSLTYVAGARLEVFHDSTWDIVSASYNGSPVFEGVSLSGGSTSTIHGMISTTDGNYATAFGYTPE